MVITERRRDTISSIDRRINYAQWQLALAEVRVEYARSARWPHHAVVPFLKQRARLQREIEYLTVLKNKREEERKERIKQAKMERLARKFNGSK